MFPLALQIRSAHERCCIDTEEELTACALAGRECTARRQSIQAVLPREGVRVLAGRVEFWLCATSFYQGGRAVRWAQIFGVRSYLAAAVRDRAQLGKLCCAVVMTCIRNDGSGVSSQLVHAAAAAAAAAGSR